MASAGYMFDESISRVPPHSHNTEQPRTWPFMHLLTCTLFVARAVRLLLAAPAPEIPANLNLARFNVQPDTGGGPQDNCGNGPLQLSADTWKAHGMDDLLKNVWDSGNGNSNFDFHQSFSSQYNVDLSCPDSFTNCIGDPSACSALSGDTPVKEQGWLGIKAILNVQAFFLQIEKVISNVFDGISANLVDFQNKFTSPTPATDNSWGRTATIFGGLFIATAFAAGAIFGPLSDIQGALGGTAANSVAALVANEALKDGKTNELQITSISDQWNDFKNELLTQIDHVHSAAFSNGFYNGDAGPRIIDIMSNGAFSGSSLVSAYEEGEGSLQGIMKSYLAAQLLQATWAAQGAFIIYIPNVTGNCAKWKKHAGNDGERRYCAPEGMYIMNSYTKPKTQGDSTRGYQDGAKGMDPATVASWGGFNIDIHDLIQSSASVYQTHGLGPSANMYDFVGFVKQAQADPGSVYRQPSVFTIPVCELQSFNWRQSDKMGTDSPPCDCLNAKDKWGNRFMDVTTGDIQDWIKSKCS
ncbi:MAG: hypothetical protein Q9228_000443 [Teloschistes exilis]